MSKAGHIQSIEALKKANESKNKINFGYIGYGLHKLDSCIYESKALIYENGNVYSIYTRI